MYVVEVYKTNVQLRNVDFKRDIDCLIFQPSFLKIKSKKPSMIVRTNCM